MRIIPVIDVLNGKVVHGIQGERNKYNPIKSTICKGADPLTVAKAFKDKFNFHEIYIADLDSITKGNGDFNYVKKISKIDLKIIIDAGITTPEGANLLFKNGASVLIIATETLNSFEQLNQIFQSFGPEKIITSIDLYQGNIMSKSEHIKNLNPIEVASKIKDIGIIESIVLELSRVGSKQGVSLEYIQKIQEKTNLKIITGGGVKSFDDLLFCMP